MGLRGYRKIWLMRGDEEGKKGGDGKMVDERGWGRNEGG